MGRGRRERQGTAWASRNHGAGTLEPHPCEGGRELESAAGGERSAQARLLLLLLPPLQRG